MEQINNPIHNNETIQVPRKQHYVHVHINNQIMSFDKRHRRKQLLMQNEFSRELGGKFNLPLLNSPLQKLLIRN